MKFKLSLLFVLFLISAVRVSADQEFFPFTATVTGDNVNIRAGANANFERLGQLSENNEVVVLGESYNWYKIRLPQSVPGYISNQFVDPDGIVTGSRVNIRARALGTSTVISKVNKNDIVQILDRQEGWYKITLPINSVGWIVKDYLSFQSKEVPPLPKATVQRLDETETELQDSTKVIPVYIPPEQIKPEVRTSTAVISSEIKSYTGTLKSLNKTSRQNLHYQLMVAPDERYLIKGYNQAFKDLEDFTVVIEGSTQINEKNPDMPFLIPKNIQLAL